MVKVIIGKERPELENPGMSPATFQATLGVTDLGWGLGHLFFLLR